MALPLKMHLCICVWRHKPCLSVLGRVHNVCPVPYTRATAIRALASLALPAHKIGISNVARRDMDAAVRAAALASLADTRPSSEDEVDSSSSGSW